MESRVSALCCTWLAMGWHQTTEQPYVADVAATGQLCLRVVAPLLVQCKTVRLECLCVTQCH